MAAAHHATGSIGIRDPNAESRPYRQVFLSNDELAYGLTVRPDLPLLTDEQKRTWEPVPWEGIATLKAEPDAVAERFGLTFQDTIDGLDLLRLAVVDLDDGLRIAFKRHRGIQAGTLLDIMPEQLVAAESLRQDLYAAIDGIQDAALRRIMDGLGLPPDDFARMSPRSIRPERC